MEIFPFDRAGGILLHPTSIPGDYGIGTLGKNLLKFLDFLHKTNMKIWQILPLGHTGYGESPYSCVSAFAGNPLLIDLEDIVDLGLLEKEDIESSEKFSKREIDFDKVISFKWKILREIFDNYEPKRFPEIENKLQLFKKENSFWLNDYTLFFALKKAHDYQAWNEWQKEYRDHNEKALDAWKAIPDNKKEVEFNTLIQFLFFYQWDKIKNYANAKDIQVLGDIPIFVDYDSADVWANQELFYLDQDKKPAFVSGVPPDLFSKTGQRWGNPLYNWSKIKEKDYTWWLQRIKYSFNQVDILRIDHFRGFEAYWQIPADEPTAIKGEWIKGPGDNLFKKFEKELGVLPIVVEDLGFITKEVLELRDQFNFPGMKLIQYAFDNEKEFNASNQNLPHWFNNNNYVAYLGTHDNETSKGWWESNLAVNSYVNQHVLDYLNSDGKDIVGDLIRVLWSSTAKIAVIQLQDLLRLDNSARMNIPATTTNNWRWRFSWDQITDEMERELLILNKLYKR